MAAINSNELIVANVFCFGAVAGLMSMLRRSFGGLTTSMEEQLQKTKLGFGPSDTEHQVVKDTLRSEAVCSGSGRLVIGTCLVRLQGHEILLEQDGRQDSVHFMGADIHCDRAVVSVSRNSALLLSLTFHSDSEAGLWMTKLAIAGGSNRSVAKILSLQHRKIQALEFNSQQAQGSSEEIERCLQFLSREYVDMRTQVRKQRRSRTTCPAPQPASNDHVDFRVPTDLLREPRISCSSAIMKHQSCHSEPEQEPFDSSLQRPQTDERKFPQALMQAGMIRSGLKLRVPAKLVLPSRQEAANITPSKMRPHRTSTPGVSVRRLFSAADLQDSRAVSPCPRSRQRRSTLGTTTPFSGR